MSSTSEHGGRLYRLLPAVYRERDNGDLESYLDTMGSVLDAIQQALFNNVDPQKALSDAVKQANALLP